MKKKTELNSNNNKSEREMQKKNENIQDTVVQMTRVGDVMMNMTKWVVLCFSSKPKQQTRNKNGFEANDFSGKNHVSPVVAMQ